ncbi:heterokaryon incompatibility protein-domain-containing protein [Xylaria arbuscula]|nr:heterokaryon incompatibility protein-domain-containing protein [Xylaria arbuscula]
MRLLRTRQYALVERNDIPIPFPQYAILSHTWISPKDEITYQDFKSRKSDIENDIFKQTGWAKLKRYCDRAAGDGWDWVWMDTCCIDKTNPADTQEAINAMFRWYQNSGICYAYLEDVDANTALDRLGPIDGNCASSLDLDTIASKDNLANPESFPHTLIQALLIKAKWFTRGWTLQELLAPPYLVFVDCAWRRIGAREHWAKEISKICRIEAKHLTGFNPTDYTSCSIAMRLSWASNRETTVEEDETYSLLGLFGISLPLIYGEGRLRAFNRLQRELITVYNDDSIFAWKAPSASTRHFLVHNKDENPGTGILAPSIREFWDASSVRCFGLHGTTFSMTNQGLEINAKRWRSRDDRTKCLIELNCGIELNRLVRIPLRHHTDNSYERMQVDRLYDRKTYDEDLWEEEHGNQSTFIRTRSNASLFAPPVIFVLESPSKVTIGEKYSFFYDGSASENMQLLVENPQGCGLNENELIIKPDQLVFINIGTDNEDSEKELDIILNVAKNGYPSAGILARADEMWERLGDPLTEPAVGMYQRLADYLHRKVPPTYPVVAFEDTEAVISICLMPRPPLKRTFKGLPEVEKFGTLREYLVTVTVGNDGDPDQDAQGRQSKRRRHG